MNILQREFCCCNTNDKLIDIETIKKFPIFMGVTTQPYYDDIYCDMTLSIGQSSGIIQQKNLIPLGKLYADSHGSGSIGKIWHDHHTKFASFISKVNPQKILEIGGGHGILASMYENIGDAKWTIIEPNPSNIKLSKAQYITGFLDDSFVMNDNYDTIVHSHVFEHIYTPVTFLSYLSKNLENGNRHIFSVPNMKRMLELNYSNCLNFEHTVFLTENVIEKLLENAGFTLSEKEYFMNDHSIFYSYIKTGSGLGSIKCFDDYNKNLLVYNNYKNFINEKVEYYNKYMVNNRSNVYLFGAHIFSQALIARGLNVKSISAVLDNDSSKTSKRLYGTQLKVLHPSILKNLIKPHVILNAGVYNDEIKSNIKRTYNSSVKFVT